MAVFAVVAVAVPLTTATAAAGTAPDRASRLVVTGTEIHPPGAYASGAFALNDNGQVLVGGEGRSYVWRRGVLTDLGSLGGDHTYAHDINERGQIVGVSGTADIEDHAFFWDRGMLTDLGIGPGEVPGSDARVIND